MARPVAFPSWCTGWASPSPASLSLREQRTAHSGAASVSGEGATGTGWSRALRCPGGCWRDSLSAGSPAGVSQPHCPRGHAEAQGPPSTSPVMQALSWGQHKAQTWGTKLLRGRRSKVRALTGPWTQPAATGPTLLAAPQPASPSLAQRSPDPAAPCPQTSVRGRPTCLTLVPAVGSAPSQVRVKDTPSSTITSRNRGSVTETPPAPSGKSPPQTPERHLPAPRTAPTPPHPISSGNVSGGFSEKTFLGGEGKILFSFN